MVKITQTTLGIKIAAKTEPIIIFFSRLTLLFLAALCAAACVFVSIADAPIYRFLP